MTLLESTIRFDSTILSIIALALGCICAALVAALPIVAAVNRRIGAATAQPTLCSALARMTGKWLAERERATLAELREADMAERWHRLAAWASRGPEVAAQPADRQRHLALVGKR